MSSSPISKHIPLQSTSLSFSLSFHLSPSFSQTDNIMLSSSSSSSSSSTSGALLAPGFRFHPTDEEIVSYYLKRKVCGKPLRFDAISEIDIYRSEPWDLPGQSRLKTRDLEWYFFSSLDKKHGNGSRTNRATEQGYWKTTGKDRPIRRYSRTVGMKKTLVFHIGRAPRGERTNWVMHEYRLEDPQLEQAGIAQGSFVLCRVFQKSGSGPKNGEQYGAPFIEEEWDEDALILKRESSGDGNTNTVSDVGEWGYVQMNDDEQNLDMGIQYDDDALVLGFNGCDGGNNLMNHARGYEGIDDQKFLNDTCEDASFPEVYVEDFFDGMDENCNLQEEHPDQYLCSMNENTNLTESDKKFPLTEDENSVESKDISPVGSDNCTGEIGDDGMIYFDASAHDHLPIEDGFFIEMDDLLNFDEARASGFEMLDDLLEYFDATSDNLHHVSLDSSSKPSEMVGSISNPLIPAPVVSTGTVQASMECPQDLNVPDMEESSSLPSVPKPEASCGLKDKITENSVANNTCGSDVPYGETWDKSLENHFRSMLESITAPPTFAVEYAAKESAKSVGHNVTESTSVRVNAGMFLVGELRVTDGGKHRFSQKGGDVGFLLSNDMGRRLMASKHVNSFDFQILLTGTPASVISVVRQAGLYLGILWVLIFGVSFKVCDYIHVR